VEQVAELMRQQDDPLHPKQLQEQINLSQTKLRIALNQLTELGVVETLPTVEVIAGEVEIAPAEAAVAASKFRNSGNSGSDRAWR